MNIKKILLFSFIILVLCSCSKKEVNELNVLNWSSYIPSEVIEDFEKEYGIKVNYGTYSSNEELLAKISSSKEGTYDLIFPSDYMVELMIKKDLLDQIDIDNIDNYSNINDIFLNQSFDQNNEYTLPFLVATTVIAYNKDNIKEDITSYNDLLNKKYKNDIVLLDDQRITLGMANLANNHKMSTTYENKLNESKEFMLELKDNVKAFDSDSPKTFLITGETNIAFLWSAEALLAKKYNDNIEIVNPKEGHAISIDNYAIVKGAKNKENAYKFINYLLDYNVNQKIIDSYPYISTLKTGEDLTYIFDKGYFVENIGKDVSIYDKLWAEIK